MGIIVFGGWGGEGEQWIEKEVWDIFMSSRTMCVINLGKYHK